MNTDDPTPDDPAPEISPAGENPENGDLPTPEDLPTKKLGPAYDHCLLGATVRGNFAYSLKRLVEFEATNRKIPPSKAREILGREIVELLRTHGSQAPEFIDDELMEEGPKIIRPATWRGRTGG